MVQLDSPLCCSAVSWIPRGKLDSPLLAAGLLISKSVGEKNIIYKYVS